MHLPSRRLILGTETPRGLISKITMKPMCSAFYTVCWIVSYSVTISSITLLNKIAEQWPSVHALNAACEIVDALEKLTQLGLITESLESFSAVPPKITFEKAGGQ